MYRQKAGPIWVALSLLLGGNVRPRRGARCRAGNAARIARFPARPAAASPGPQTEPSRQPRLRRRLHPHRSGAHPPGTAKHSLDQHRPGPHAARAIQAPRKYAIKSCDRIRKPEAEPAPSRRCRTGHWPDCTGSILPPPEPIPASQSTRPLGIIWQIQRHCLALCCSVGAGWMVVVPPTPVKRLCCGQRSDIRRGCLRCRTV